MAHRDLTGSPAARAVALVAVAALAAVVVVLCLLALQRDDAADAGGPETPAPAPTFTFGSSTDAPAEGAGGTDPEAPAPSPAAPAPGSGTSGAPVAPGAGERFLARGSEGSLWRATAGACGETEPLVERSDDEGESWVDVTPRYREIGQVRALYGFAGTEAEMVADLGDCEAEWLRTFTQGSFWEPYPDLLESATYPSADDPAVLVTPSGDVALPCASPWSLRVGAQQSAVVCDGVAHVRVGAGAWSALPVGNVAAVDVVARETAVVHADAAACPDGLAVSRVDADGTVSPAGCVEDAEPAEPVAIAAFDGELLVWAGDAVTPLTD